jgi:hypothetical protein
MLFLHEFVYYLKCQIIHTDPPIHSMHRDDEVLVHYYLHSVVEDSDYWRDMVLLEEGLAENDLTKLLYGVRIVILDPILQEVGIGCILEVHGRGG